MTEIPADEGKLYLSMAIGRFSCRLLGSTTSCHPDAEPAGQAIKMAVCGAGWEVSGVIFHTNRGLTYIAYDFTALCPVLGVRQSMGRMGSCFDNAANSFFSKCRQRGR